MSINLEHSHAMLPTWVASEPALPDLDPANVPFAAREAQAPVETLARHALRFEQLRARQAAEGLPSDAAGFEQARALRAQMLLQLQRFHDFEYLQGHPDTWAVQHSGETLASDSPEVRGKALLNATGVSLEAMSSGSSASGHFFDDLRGLIDLVGAEYLAVYENVIQRYSAMFKAFNEQVTAKLAEHIKGIDDGKKVQLNGNQIRSALIRVINQFAVYPAGALYPLPGQPQTPSSYQDSLRWAAAMGLPASQVQPRPPFAVMMDATPLYTILNSIPGSDVVEWDSARFQAWQTGFNTQESEMKNQLQVFTSKYANAHAYHDNFNKVLSSQLSQYAEMLKAYLNF